MLIWYAAGMVAAIAIGWIAAAIHASGNAPIGLVPICVGVALGASVAGLATIKRAVSGRRLVIGVIVLAIVTIAAEHVWLYLDFRRQWKQSRDESAAVAMFRSATPPTAREYFAHEFTPGRGMLWFADAAMVVGATVGTFIVLRRKYQQTRLNP